MNILKRRTGVVTAATILLLGATGMQTVSAATATCPGGVTTITFGSWPSNILDVPIYVAMKKGFAKENCLEFKLIAYKTPGDFPRGLISGEINAALDTVGAASIARRDGELGKILKIHPFSTKSIYEPTNMPAYVLMGPDKPGTRTLAQMVDGKTIATSRLSWTGAAIVLPTTRPSEVPSAPTEVIAQQLRDKLPGHRIFYGAKSEDSASAAVKAKTTYFVPVGFNTRRVSEYLSGHADMATMYVPSQLAMVRRGLAYPVIPINEAPAFPDTAVTVLTATWDNPHFQNVIFPRLQKSLQEATAWLLKDQERTAEFLLSIAKTARRGSILTIKDMVDARAAASFGMDGFWSKTGCIKPEGFRTFVKIMGIKKADPTEFYPEQLVCSN